jgi:hypothetical protein
LDKEAALWLHHCLWQTSLETGCCAQGNKTKLAGDIALDILLVQVVFLDLPHLDQSCLDAIDLHVELDLSNSPFLTFLVKNDIFIENLPSLGKSGTHGVEDCASSQGWSKKMEIISLCFWVAFLGFTNVASFGKTPSCCSDKISLETTCWSRLISYPWVCCNLVA